MFPVEGWSSRNVQNPSGRREWGKYQGLEEKPVWLEQGEPEGACRVWGEAGAGPDFRAS